MQFQPLRRSLTSSKNRPEWFDHGITTAAVDEYLYSLLPPRDEVLAEMEAEAIQRKIPIVGPAVARILHQLALLIQAKTVFELGSAIGYSTIWWARAVGENGRVIYTDSNRKNADQARRYFDRAGVGKQISVKVGDVLSANREVATLILPQHLWVRVYVPESWLGRVQLGQAVKARVDSFAGRDFEGSVEQINRSAEFTPRNVQTVDERIKQVFGVKVRLKNENDQLRAGMSADVIFSNVP